MKSISAKELSEWKKSGKPHQLIDVRESYEVDTCSINGINIPMEEIIHRAEEINREIPVVIHCKSGKRSAAVIHTLEQKFNLSNLYTLEGGIIAWIDEVDHSLVKY
jgi:sulfur-carrier protein adenylyltransferase/sulfurtransferase